MKEKQGNLMDFLLDIEPLLTKDKYKPIKKLTQKRKAKTSTLET